MGLFKKNTCIKHKLWGRLKKQAHEHYRIVPCSDNWRYYHIEYRSTDGGYEYLTTYCTLEEAIKRVQELREKKFESLCAIALYERRLKKVSAL